MSHSRIFIAVALLVAGAFLASPAMADASKNGGTPTSTVSKNGGPPSGPPSKNGGCTSNCGGGGGGGCGINCGYTETKYVCIVNGRRFFVKDWRQCMPRPHYACDCAPPRHVIVHHHYRHAPVRYVPAGCGCEDQAYYQGGYGYYAGGSLAARMQAERRAGSYAMTDGGVYASGDGYGYREASGDGYGYGESYGEATYQIHRHHHHKAWRRAYSYNPGYVIHYGPTISKDGGY